MTILTDVWDRLQTDVVVEEGYVRLRIPEVRACAAYAAKRVADNLEAVVLEVPTQAIRGDPLYPISVGFEVSTLVLEPGRSGRTRLLLSLLSERFRDVFYTLADDVIQAISAASNETEVVSQFISRLTRWQAFLRKHGPGGLSLEAMRGLYGELSFLRDQLLSQCEELEAVRAWEGCRGANHDYRCKCGSVEVKTTRANTPHGFRVSNIKQLDDSGLENLILCFFIVDEGSTGGESLPELVDSIREQLQGSALGIFDDALVEAGFIDIQRRQYASPNYTVRNVRFFQVREGFPRLLETALPNGVEDVGYAVAVAACAPFECAEEEALKTVLQGSQENE